MAEQPPQFPPEPEEVEVTKKVLQKKKKRRKKTRQENLIKVLDTTLELLKTLLDPKMQRFISIPKKNVFLKRLKEIKLKFNKKEELVLITAFVKRHKIRRLFYLNTYISQNFLKEIKVI